MVDHAVHWGRCCILGAVPSAVDGHDYSHGMARPEIGVAGHFARQMRKERQAHGWSLAELGRRADWTPRTWDASSRPPPAHRAGRSRAGRGVPVTAGLVHRLAVESREWAEVQATFRSWPDYEDRAGDLRTWNTGILDGLVQAEDSPAR